MERANLKARRPEVYTRLEAAWQAWNATMLPEIDESSTDNLTGDKIADRPGAGPNGAKADNPAKKLPTRPGGRQGGD
jgi:hypothetical protein